MNCITTDLTDLLGVALPDPAKENAAPAGPRNGVETKAELQSALSESRESAAANQAWDGLNSARRWIAWRECDRNGKPAKVPYAADDLEPLRTIMGTQHGKSWSRGSHCEIALHLGNRYFTVTEQRLDHAPATIQPVNRAALTWLIEDEGPRFKGDAPK